LETYISGKSAEQVIAMMLNPSAMAVAGVHNKHQDIKEPDKAKVLRPVLETSGWGDPPAEFN
jgi:hypothetical protein